MRIEIINTFWHAPEGFQRATGKPFGRSRRSEIPSQQTKYLLNKNEYLKSGNKNAIAELYFNEESNIVKEIINDYYHPLLIDLDKKTTRDGFSSFSCLEYYNNDELQDYVLLAQDIIAARNKFYIKCPNCGTKNKITSSNWVFVKLNNGYEKYLSCTKCKGNEVNG
jgi:hypothetical protein